MCWVKIIYNQTSATQKSQAKLTESCAKKSGKEVHTLYDSTYSITREKNKEKFVQYDFKMVKLYYKVR